MTQIWIMFWLDTVGVGKFSNRLSLLEKSFVGWTSQKKSVIKSRNLKKMNNKNQ